MLVAAVAVVVVVCLRAQSVVAPLVRASLALHNEGALLPFLAGDLTPVDLMYRLSGVRAERSELRVTE